MKAKIYDCLIIGGGPAGLSAALGLGRVRRSAMVFDSRMYRNAMVEEFHYFPSRDSSDPAKFREITRDQIVAKYTSIEFQDTKIVKAANLTQGAEEETKETEYEVEDERGEKWRGKKLILATGSKDVPPEIDGYATNWARHIYQCPFCDGFEEADKPVGVLEFTSPMHLFFAVLGFQFDKRVTIFSNGPVSAATDIQSALAKAKARGVKIDERKIKRFVDEGKAPERGITIEFEEGECVSLGMLLHKPPTVNVGQALIEQMSLETRPKETGGEVEVKDMFQQTSLRGCFVAGDTASAMKSVVTAAAQGVAAAGGVNHQLCADEIASL
ncbi:FAD/NAD(P)-binding domain-containing protein [Aulographum hederae CBS 113979]|uniref:FAD/NAD(P)-binding domain-containing protein n=1 Tax=Aulographum hederae CBS 113979 TaxID=1176131 RepID=A0A6G1H4Y8_9PEZI|nr:FAD/NAD(P)-binding domain-containing protein [Aulographum hederae CBS 113979]